MENFHGRSRTKGSGSGGKRKKFRDVSLSEVGGPFTATKVGEAEVREAKRTRGGGVKTKLKRAAFVNVVVKPGETKRARIRTVLESPANRHYARQNIIVKGTLIDTEIGRVRVTNRVGQDGVVNGVLAEEKKAS
ncbi:MAG: 30S ribosomal protein S8e [Candidatus Micrarchaeia archaeon]